MVDRPMLMGIDYAVVVGSHYPSFHYRGCPSRQIDYLVHGVVALGHTMVTV